MQVGVFLQTSDLASGRAIGIADLVSRAQAVEDLGFDSVWVMDHIMMEGGHGARATSYDPMLILGAIAQHTRRIVLGPLVLNASPYLRHPAVIAREAASLQQISGGRLILGIGAGWYKPEFDAHNIPFDHLVSRFESTLDTLIPMIDSGDTVVACRPRPPVLIGGSGPRMLRLVARYADVWNQSFGGADAEWYAKLVVKLGAALAAEGRAESSIQRSVGVSVIPVANDWEIEEVARRARQFARSESDLGYLTGSTTTIAGHLKRYADAGADQVIVQLSSMSALEWDPNYLYRFAEVLPLLR